MSQNSHRSNGAPVEPKVANGHANGLPEAEKSAVTSKQSVFDLGFELDDLYKLALRFYKGNCSADGELMSWRFDMYRHMQIMS